MGGTGLINTIKLFHKNIKLSITSEICTKFSSRISKSGVNTFKNYYWMFRLPYTTITFYRSIYNSCFIFDVLFLFVSFGWHGLLKWFFHHNFLCIFSHVKHKKPLNFFLLYPSVLANDFIVKIDYIKMSNII